MSTHPERDPAIDPLIRAAIRPRDPGDPSGCVDAERLAAWAEGGLTEAETEAIDAHLATCARCQALMAAFAQEPAAASIPAATPSAPAVLPFRPRAAVKWIVPLAAGVAAASLLVWTAWPRPGATPVREQTVADAITPASPPANARRAEETSAIGAQGRGALAVPELKKEAAPVAAAKSSDAKLGQQGAIAAAPSPSPAPAPVPPAITVPPTPIPMAGGVPQVTIAAPPPTAPTFRAQAAGTGEVVMLRGDADPVRDAAPPTPARVVAEFAPPTAAGPDAGRAFGQGGAGGGRGGGRGGGGGGGSRGTGAAGASGIAAATAPAPRVLWRVLATGEVRKSTDNAQTWSTVVMKPPVLILNGAAPSPTVCWLIGRAGIVMLSTDGVKFVRVFFPDLSDLRSITAVDAREATITTTDGRVFVTIDGGENWEIKK